MLTLKITERERDALYSVLRPYADGIAAEGYFHTHDGRQFTDEESAALLRKLKTPDLIESGAKQSAQ